jgi:hypothetical protein
MGVPDNFAWIQTGDALAAHGHEQEYTKGDAQDQADDPIAASPVSYNGKDIHNQRDRKRRHCGQPAKGW